MRFCVPKELLNLRLVDDLWPTVPFALLAMFVLSTQPNLLFALQDTTVHKHLSQCKLVQLALLVLAMDFQQRQTAATVSEVGTAPQLLVPIFLVFATKCTIASQTQTLPCLNSKQLVPPQTS